MQALGVSMTTIGLFAIALLAALVGVVLFRIIPVVCTYFQYRGKRIVTCPETLEPEAVDLAAGKAAISAFSGGLELRIEQCSRWPERRDCGQECLDQIRADPDNYLVWNIVSHWYEGQSCALCHKHFGRLHHLDPPALMRPDQKTIEWNSSRPSNFPRPSPATSPSAGAATSPRRSGKYTLRLSRGGKNDLVGWLFCND